ncbi:MAG: glycosyltransferase [Bacteroidetes bacterium]|nr:glycosyltransferase [Bacteroidota bacterium]
MNPLVSVAVATYNSAAFVEETLESIFNQSYSPIALVVSDDCSKDNTVEIVQNWLAQDRVVERFDSIQLVTVPENTGISANCNRSIAAAPSDYVKFIAGDDIILPDGIQKYMAFAIQNPQARIIFSQIRVYQDHFKPESYVKTTPLDYPHNLMDEKLTAHDQYQLLLLSDRIHYTPSFFQNKQAILKVGGYDEENKLVEDYPMWLKLTQAGERLYYFHQETVGYRIHSKAANNTGQHVIFKPSVLYSFKIRQRYAHPHLPWEIVASEYQVYYLSKLFDQLGWNQNTPWLSRLYRLGTFYLNPFQYFYALNKRLPQNKNNLFYQ